MNPMNMRPIISVDAARLILKNVPRSFLHVNTGILRDAKTMEILGHVEPELPIVGKKFVTEKDSLTDEFSQIICFHKNSKKYIKPRLKKIISRINLADFTERREAVQSAA